MAGQHSNHAAHETQPSLIPGEVLRLVVAVLVGGRASKVPHPTLPRKRGGKVARGSEVAVLADPLSSDRG